MKLVPVASSTQNSSPKASEARKIFLCGLKACLIHNVLATLTVNISNNALAGDGRARPLTAPITERFVQPRSLLTNGMYQWRNVQQCSGTIAGLVREAQVIFTYRKVLLKPHPDAPCKHVRGQFVFSSRRMPRHGMHGMTNGAGQLCCLALAARNRFSAYS